MRDDGATFFDKLRLARRVGALAGHVLWERASGLRPAHAEDVPRSHAEITPEWLTEVLCAGIAGAQVLKVIAIGGSDGTSSRQALQLHLNDAALAAGVPTRLFSKSTKQFVQRVVLGMSNSIYGEPLFYSHLRSKLDIEAPRAYYAKVDPRSFRSMILMEDIAVTRGARFNDPSTPISRSQIEDLLANMARWHGRFWSDPVLNTYSTLEAPVDFLRRISKFIGMRERSRVGAQRAESMIPPALRSQQDALWRGLGASFEMNAGLPPTLLHGDSHVGQTFITDAGRMGFSDWQVIQRGGWAYDFAYTVLSALTVDNRRLWERDLLRFYIDRLHAAGGAHLTFDEAWLTYRQHCFYPYFAWVFTIGYGWLQPKMQPDDICLSIIERTSHALHDLESLKAVSA